MTEYSFELDMNASATIPDEMKSVIVKIDKLYSNPDMIHRIFNSQDVAWFFKSSLKPAKFSIAFIRQCLYFYFNNPFKKTNQGQEVEKVLKSHFLNLALEHDVQMPSFSKAFNASFDMFWFNKHIDFKFLTHNFAHWSTLAALWKIKEKSNAVKAFLHDMDEYIQSSTACASDLQNLLEKYTQQNEFLFDLAHSLLSKYQGLSFLYESSSQGNFYGQIDLEQCKNQVSHVKAVLHNQYFEMDVYINHSFSLKFKVGAVGRTNIYKKNYKLEVKFCGAYALSGAKFEKNYDSSCLLIQDEASFFKDSQKVIQFFQ